MGLVFHYSNSNPNSDRSWYQYNGVYGCDRTDRVVFGRIVDGLWNGEPEKSLGVENSVSCSVGAGKIRM